MAIPVAVDRRAAGAARTRGLLGLAVSLGALGGLAALLSSSHEAEPEATPRGQQFGITQDVIHRRFVETMDARAKTFAARVAQTRR